MKVQVLAVVLVSALAGLGGCLGGEETPEVRAEAVPSLAYLPADPDAALTLVESDHWLTGDGGTEIHVRVVRPPGEGPFPVIAQFTPYTSPGQNVHLNDLAEPQVGCQVVPIGAPGVATLASFPIGCEGAFDWHFVRRGFAFAYGDVRGTGDSSGCLDLRGALDIADLWHLTEWLGTQEWSNGNVGFIGASYPGSEAHMAALAGNPHLKAVIPVVASTSFYHYHHNDGVPYRGQHSLGGTNTGYTQNAAMATVNPQAPNYLTRMPEEAQCPHAENIVMHGGLDQTGSYYDWWQERDLRGRASTVQVPVLMAQGLNDWNVKPDHIATWFNDLSVNKTLIAGQWHHAYPFSVCAEDQNGATCDNGAPYGNWWQYAAAFFETYLKGVGTGMFQGSVAWVEDSLGNWHRSADWPLLPEQREELVLSLHGDGALREEPVAEDGTLTWYGCGDDQHNMGQGQLATLEYTLMPCDAGGMAEQLVFETEPFATDVIVSGVPVLELSMRLATEYTHVVVLVEVMNGTVQPVNREVREAYFLGERENYGYLNTLYRSGLEKPSVVRADELVTVAVDLYPQEDVIQAGEWLRLTVKSDDVTRIERSDGSVSEIRRTIEAFPSGQNTLQLGPTEMNRLVLPLRPLGLQGVRLTEG